jgi:hemerythrin-like domain-containing protein
MTDLNLETRTGWPDELRLYLERFPRETWPGHPNLGQLARFWLQIHSGFRTYGETLKTSAHDFREGRVTPEEFRARFAPRLQVFLSHLNGHHQIEDYQFFPTFSAAEPRLVTGFDVLERDHDTIHHSMDRMVETANAFMAVPAGDKDRIRFAGDEYASTGEGLLKLLDRHLGDEEDLIIPIILDRGEDDLGL